MLGLDHDRSKTQTVAVDEPHRSFGPVFLELPSSIVSNRGVFEFDHGAGAAMRVELVGHDAADVEGLARGSRGAR